MNMHESILNVGFVEVNTTNNRGFTPEEVAERCLNKLISVSDTAPPAIRDQAFAYKENLRAILVFYMREAVNSDRTTVQYVLLEAGHKDLADLIRRL